MQIREARASKNMTQEEMAKVLGVTRSTVAMWETGEAMPRADKLPELARTLGRTIDELFGEGAGASEKVHKK